MEKKDFKKVRFRGVFRSYQQKVLDEVERHLEDGRIHIVAAPGSGKTVLGLEVVRMLGRPALVLSPTIVIADQWGERFSDLFMPDGESETGYISEDLKKPALITSITYQALYSAWNKLSYRESSIEVKGTDETESREGVHEYDFHDFDPVACVKNAGIRTICLDEAHHLKREWQKALAAFIEAVSEDVTIVALTATPPYDSSEAEWQSYISLCGEIDTEIFVPELIAQKTLCPHQDYIMFNYPTSAECEAIISYRQNITDCMDEVVRSGLFAAAAVRCGLVGDILPLQDQLYRHAEGYISFAVCARHTGLPHSKALEKKLLLGRPLPDFDIGHLQRAFSFIAEQTEVFGEELAEQMTGICRRHRLVHRGKLLIDDTKRVGRELSSSLGKLESICGIAQEEYEQLGDKLRLLVLTDNIRKDFVTAVGTDEEIDAMGAVPIFEKLRRALKPEARIGMLSGSLVIWPLDRIEAIEEIAGRYNTAFTYAEIVKKGIPGISLTALPSPPLSLQGRDAENALIPATPAPARYASLQFSGSRRAMIAVLTEAFQKGAVQTIVGTKALLGEGWDSPCINSLILASFVGSYVLSNQMRGRAIRTDRDNPNKTANIWHLVAIEPAFADEKKLLSEDFRLLRRRFKMFFGPNYSGGTITNGIDRLDIIQPPFDEAGITRINAEMKRLAADREGMAKTWSKSLGKAPAPRVADANFVPKEILPKLPRLAIIENSISSSTVIAGVLTLIIMRATPFALLAHALGTAPQILTSFVALGCSLWIGWRPLRTLFRARSSNYALRRIAECLCKTMKAHGFIKTPGAKVCIGRVLGYSDTTCYLDNATTREQHLFGDALHEMLSPIGDPRYVIVRQGKASTRFDYKWSFAAPSLFGKYAPIKDLCGLLSKTFGQCVAVYTRTESGYRMLHQCRAMSFTAAADGSERKFLVLDT